MPTHEQVSLYHTPGGIPVIIEKLPYFRSVALSVNVMVGSRDEAADKSGIAHLLEHLMFKGTKDQSAKQIADMIEGAGGELNGFTTKEMTSFHVFSLDETIETAEKLLSSMMVHPLIDDDHVQVEKGVVAQEINMLEEEPESYAHVLLDRSIWRGHPMANSESGEVGCVRRISTEDLRSFYERNYRKPKLTVVACGNLNPKQVLKWAAENFDDIGTAKGEVKRSTPRFRSSIDVYPKDGDQAYVELGVPAFGAKQQQRFAASLAAVILGAGTSSRLYQRIREEEGLVYTIYMSPAIYSDCGVIEGYFSSSVENAEKVIQLSAEEMRRFKNEGLEKGELERAKRWVKGVFLRKLESTENRMYWLGENHMLTGKVKSLQEMVEEFESITEEDVVKTANEVLKVKKLCMAIHAPEKEGKELAKNIRGIDF
ncbi:MAG: Peptidase M16 inactive domain protein [Methanomassiliicoccales archaeon PtaU1.Bin124]|nr:MAG: Peptidase M16 inactive domain protein [Methanomassiliicoccales archaeon PtaU1.Bin124]